MTIFNPNTGRTRYRVGEDLKVEDLSDPPVCKHEPDPQKLCCKHCGKITEITNE